MIFLQGNTSLKNANCRLTIPHSQDDDHDTPSQAFTLLKKTASILEQALTTRVNLISVVASGSKVSHGVNSSRTNEPTILTLGLLLDPEQSRRLVDHGPSADNREAALAFRTFWGEKAELRRFKDGSILESVVWNCKNIEERYAIVKRIVRYIIARHLSAGVAGDIVFLTPSLSAMLEPPPDVKKTYVRMEGDAFATLGDAFDVFVRHLNDLKDMPLAISSVVPVGTGLTHTSIYPPYARNYSHLSAQEPGSYYAPIQETIIRLEGSGKWPEDLKAIQKVKIGVLLHMAGQLEKTHSVSAQVGLENSRLDIANQGYLDVIYEHGYAFRIRIQHDPNHREAYLSERALKNKGLPHLDKSRFENALKLYQENFIYTSTHAQALHGLRGKYYFLPNTIRLVKRWISAHMLTRQVSEQAIELLVCYIFLHPHPFHAPASAEVGFLRTLKLLATWDWRREPLVIDLDESMADAKYEEVGKAFEGFRKQDPGISHAAWSIYPTYDNSGVCWTKDKPGKVVAARLTALARSSLEVISKDSSCVKVSTVWCLLTNSKSSRPP
jgi:U3 small nucleolar RNA-associated protein 22